MRKPHLTRAQVDILDGYCKQREKEQQELNRDLSCTLGIDELRGLVNMALDALDPRCSVHPEVKVTMRPSCDRCADDTLDAIGG